VSPWVGHSLSQNSLGGTTVVTCNMWNAGLVMSVV